MDTVELSSALNQLVSVKVAYRRIAANSIIVYFYGEPGDSSVVSLFIDPTWRYERDGEIVLGSFDLQIEQSDFGSKEEYEIEWNRRCGLVDNLEGAELLSCDIDRATCDLTLVFSGEQVLRNFANSAFDDKTWTYRNKPQNLAATVSPLGIKVRQIKSETNAER